MEDLPWQVETMFTGWLKDVPFPVLLVRQVFTNKDGSTGTLYLACSDTSVTRKQILTTYQKRWPVEVFHKSLEQNPALGKAPVRTVVTQNNHVFAVLYAIFKLECLKIKQHLNHFALRAHLYLRLLASPLKNCKPSRLRNISYLIVKVLDKISIIEGLGNTTL
jgi:hypothetical protein